MRKLWLAASVAAAMLASGHASSAEPFSYKGVRLGDTVETFTSKLPDYSCKGTACTFSMDLCRGSSVGILDKAVLDAYVKRGDDCRNRTSFGGSLVTNGRAEFRDGVLVSVSLTLPTSHVERLGEVLATTFGDPASTDSTPIKNRMGVEFPSWQKIWTQPGGTLLVALRAGRVDEGMVILQSEAEAMRQAEHRKKSVEAGSKDF